MTQYCVRFRYRNGRDGALSEERFGTALLRALFLSVAGAWIDVVEQWEEEADAG